MPSITPPFGNNGPIIEVQVSVSRSRRYALSRFGVPVPDAVQVRALIDTGASFSCVDAPVVARLNLSPKGSTPVLTPTTGAVPQAMNRYDVNFELLPPSSGTFLSLENFPILEASLSAQGIQALIGRDILARCVFVFDGPANNFTLSV